MVISKSKKKGFKGWLRKCEKCGKKIASDSNKEPVLCSSCADILEKRFGK